METAAAAKSTFTRDQFAEHDRLLKFLRAHGYLSHTDLAEILGVGDHPISHKHPDAEEKGFLGDAIPTVQVTEKDASSGEEKRVAKKMAQGPARYDTVAARFYVQEILEPGSTKKKAA